MTIYIDADAFAEKLKSLHGYGDFEANFYGAETCYGLGNWVWECQEDYGIEAAENELKSFPADDVAPVVYTRWVGVQNGRGCCSNCNRLDGVDPLATHCRYCGAKIDWEGAP